MANKKISVAPKSRTTARPQSSGPRSALPQGPRPSAPTRVDPSSQAYRQAARKYTSLMVAMPILLVTSYVLFDRLVLGKQAKSLAAKPVETTAPIIEQENVE
ncbi:hypothetical protein F5X99DRAFT_156297 [Biscogniauxia marginata]|nr:hypothetical protein F5X99DRAFT_156297 [Biscogniauxia marginata]